MGKLYGLTVGRNESSRYLESMLTQATAVVDELLYYDDDSDDSSLDIALRYGSVHATVKPEFVPSFLVHEGRFRQDAWDFLQKILPIQSDDWVLAIDTDEVLTSTVEQDLREAVDKATAAAEMQGADSVILPIPEVFAVEDGVPQVRVDALWGTIRGFRLFRYRQGGVYKDKPMGCGAEPTYVELGRKSTQNFGLCLMHFGYADKRDQVSKYRRYTDLSAHGHNNNHVNSIITAPVLQPWGGVPTLLERAS